MLITVVGLGYVGLTAAVGLAESGHKVIGIDHNPDRIELLQRKIIPFHEPGLEAALSTVAIDFRTETTELTDAVIVAVSTPLLPGDEVDTREVRKVIGTVISSIQAPSLIIVKSTIPPGTSDELVNEFPELRERYIHNPEFLSQGQALADWRTPDRLVLGLWNQALLPLVEELYHDLSAPRVVTAPREAEMVKYASNAFLATKISFTNEIARWCETQQINVDDVIKGVSLDPRMGQGFWRPGLGYGDSCLGKDVALLTRRARDSGRTMLLLESVTEVNTRQQMFPMDFVHDISPAPDVAVLGLLYEPGSDDMRAAPSLRLLPALAARAARLRVWDPVLTAETVQALFPGVDHVEDVTAAVTGATVIIALTEFPEVTGLDWHTVAQAAAPGCLVIDAKNMLDQTGVISAGLTYRGVGRVPADVEEP